MTEKKEASLRRTVILTLLASTLVFALLLCAGVYVLQIILAPRLRSISFAVEFPVPSVAVALAALLLSRLLGESKQLKEDNDLFV